MARVAFLCFMDNFFFPTFSLSRPLSLSPITDCPSLGQILFMLLEKVGGGSAVS